MAIDRDALITQHDPILTARLARLAETHIPLADGRIYRPPDRDEALETLDSLVLAAATHIDNCQFRTVVVPASGGADSTFLLWILRHAVDHLNATRNKDVKVIGFTLPCTLQGDAEYLDDMGLWSCELYADDYTSVNVGPAHAFVSDSLFNLDAIHMKGSGQPLSELVEAVNPNYPSREVRVDRGNTAARLRMIFAYGIAKRLGGAQCSTDNLSEGYTGFWTLCGDEGTFKYIQGVLKGLEEPVLMAAAGIPSPFIVQLETDGLGVADGDVSQLYGSLFDSENPQTYYDVDTVIVNDLGGAEYPDPRFPDIRAEDHPVVRWNRRTEFKRSVFCLGRGDLGLIKIPGLPFAI
jgi:NH3-dependent NAD+ synthetase